MANVNTCVSVCEQSLLIMCLKENREGKRQVGGQKEKADGSNTNKTNRWRPERFLDAIKVFICLSTNTNEI